LLHSRSLTIMPGLPTLMCEIDHIWSFSAEVLDDTTRSYGPRELMAQLYGIRGAADHKGRAQGAVS
jgi:hypothetical protein